MIIKLKENLFINKESGRVGRKISDVEGTKFKEPKREPIITQYILQLTQRCNLACRHCFNEFYSGRKGCMEKETAKEILDRTFDYMEKMGLSMFNIVLHGGESTLCLDVMEFICKYIQKHDFNINVSLQTNATLLDRALSIIRKYGIGLSISIDGTADMHNAIRVYPNGRGSFEDVYRNIKLVDSFHPLVTVSKYNAKRFDEVLDFLLKFNINSISTIFVFNRPELRADVRDVEIFAEKIVDRAVREYLLNGRFIEIRELSVVLKHAFSEHRYACWRSPCAAALSVVAVDPEGCIYPCDCLIDEYWFLGNLLEKDLENIVKNEKAEKLRSRDYRKISPCKDCIFGAICQASCPSQA